MTDGYPITIVTSQGTVFVAGRMRFNDPNQSIGASWYDGSGAPSDAVGVDGDYYLDDDSGAVYRKEGGTWQ